MLCIITIKMMMIVVAMIIKQVLVITEGYGVRATVIAVLCVSLMWQIVKMHMIILRVIEGPNVHDQTAFCVFHSFFKCKSKRMLQELATYMRRIHNNNPEIRIAGIAGIAGSACCCYYYYYYYYYYCYYCYYTMPLPWN